MGEASHLKLLPPTRKAYLKAQKQNVTTPKQAGVLALFYPNIFNETCFVLMLRKTYKGVHSAQVSFPGGKLEVNDTNLAETALRETFEEIGVPKTQIHIIKDMSQVYVPPSNFIVQPFLGLVVNTPVFVKAQNEVETLIEVRLMDLLADCNMVQKYVATSYTSSIEVPAFEFHGHTVWGATAMMLSEIKDMFKLLV